MHCIQFKKKVLKTKNKFSYRSSTQFKTKLNNLVLCKSFSKSLVFKIKAFVIPYFNYVKPIFCSFYQL